MGPMGYTIYFDLGYMENKTSWFIVLGPGSY